MEGRKRTVQVKFYVTEEERRLIREKMKLIPTRNMAAYLRKMAIDGYVVHIDTTDIRAQTAELQKIGVNVNQIARRLNSMGPLYTQDVADIKVALAQIWQLQRYPAVYPPGGYELFRVCGGLSGWIQAHHPGAAGADLRLGAEVLCRPAGHGGLCPGAV